MSLRLGVVRLFLIVVWGIFMALKTHALEEAPQTFTLSGTLYQTGTNKPLYDASTKVLVQILNPEKTCLLYEEQQTISVGASGFFSVQVGSVRGATKRTTNDPNHTMSTIFQNVGMMFANNLNGASCLGGIYVPNAGDTRYIRLTVTPSSTNIADTLVPDIAMNSAPSAIVAQSVQGLERSKILQVKESNTVSLNQATLEWLFNNVNYSNLQTLLAGGLIAAPGNGVTLPSYGSTPTNPTAGAIWYDSTTNSIKFHNGSSVQSIGGGGGSGITSLTVGANMTANGTPGGTLTGPGTIDIKDSGVAANTYTKVTVNTKGLVTAGGGLLESDVPTLATAGKVSGSAINTGTIGGNAAINTTGNITTTGTVTANNFSVNNIYSPNIYGGSTASANLTLDSTSNATKGNVIIAPSGGNVGIGTTTPTNLLTVAGNIAIDGGAWAYYKSNAAPGVYRGLLMSSNWSNRWNVYTDSALETGSNTGSDFNIARYDDAGTFMNAPVQIRRDTGDISLGVGGGNVGIGTTTTNAKLVLRGDTSDSSSVALNVTDSNSASKMYIRNDGWIGFGQTTPSGWGGEKFNFNGNTSINGSLNLWNGTVYNVTAISSGANGTLPLAISTNGGGESARFDSAGRLLVGYSVDQGGGQKIQVSSGAYFNGNVGVGTTTPGAPLEVNGDIMLSKGGARTISIPTAASGAGNGLTIRSGNGATNGDPGGGLNLLAGNGYWGNPGALLVMASSGFNGGSVTLKGGTADLNGASGAVTIEGGSNGGNTLGGNVFVKGGVGGSNNVNGGNVYVSGGQPGGTGSNGNIVLGHDGTTARGKVGVGVTAPTARLHLPAGTAGANSSPLKFDVGVLNTTPENGAVEFDGSYLYVTSGGVRRSLATSAGAGTYDNVTTISNSSGNITLSPLAGSSVVVSNNVASTSPSTGALVVNGGIGAAGAIHSGTSVNAPLINGGTSASGNLTIDSTSNATKGNILLAPTGGNVGIGTSTPTEKLDVNGRIISNGANPVLLEGATGAIYTSEGLWNITTGSNAKILARSTGPLISRDVADANAALTVNQINAGSTGNILDLKFNNSTKLQVSKEGYLGIGTSPGPNKALDIFIDSAINSTTSVDSQSLNLVGRYDSSAYGERRLTFYKSRGTEAVPTAVQDGDLLSSIYSSGQYDGSSAAESTLIRSWVDGVVGPNIVPGRLEFATSDSSGVMATRMVIKPNGNVGIGTTTPGSTFDINGAQSMRGMAAPAASPAGQGRIYFDSTANKFKVSENNGAYVDLVGGGGGGGLPAAAGTAAAPGYAFLGNTNTGMFGAATNQIGFSTNGAERLRIDASGKVGIGTTTPSYQLDNVGGFFHTGFNTGSIPPSDNTNGGLIVGWNRSGGAAEVNLYNAYDLGGTNSFVFSQKTGAATMIDLMTLQRNGNVGIGTTSPVDLLTVNTSTGNATMGVRSTWGSSTLTLQSFVNYWNIVNDNSGKLSFSNSGTPTTPLTLEGGAATNSIYVKSDGYVGIGTSTPSKKLDVNGDFQAVIANAGLNNTNPKFHNVVGSISNSTNMPSGSLIANHAQYIDSSFQAGTHYPISNYISVAGNTSATALMGVYSRQEVSAGYTGSVNQYSGFTSDPYVQNASGSVSDIIGYWAFSGWVDPSSTTNITNWMQTRIENPAGGTNKYGLFIANITGATGSNYSIYSVGGKNYFGGSTSIGTTNSTAKLQLGGATTSANSAPLKFDTGTLMTTPENGAVEFDGNYLYLTSGGVRRSLATSAGAGTYDNVTTISNSSGNITLSPLAGSSVVVSNNVASTSPTTGALIVNGGIGAAGAIHSGTSLNAPLINGGTAASGNLTIDSTSDATKGNIILAPNGGKVGIGTTTPTSRLSVTDVITMASGANSSNYTYSVYSPNSPPASGTLIYGSATQLTSSGAQDLTNANLFGGAFTAEHNQPSTPLGVTGVLGTAELKTNVGTTNNLMGAQGRAYNSSASGTIGNAVGVGAVVDNNTGTITNAVGLYSKINPTSGTITNSYGLLIDSIAGTNKWGLYQSDANAKNYMAGKLGFGVSSPTTTIALNGSVPHNIAIERNIASDTAGQSLTISAGSATVGSTNKTGGDVYIQTGISTGNASSKVVIQTSAGVSSGTADKALSNALVINGDYVGIGLGSGTNPGYPLEVRTSQATATGIFINSEGSAGSSNLNSILKLDRRMAGGSAPSAGFGGALDYQLEGFTESSAPVVAKISATWENTQANDTTDRDSNLIFTTMADNSLVEKMRITSSGAVGIGQTAPSARLGIGGGASLTVSASKNTAGLQIAPATSTDWSIGGTYANINNMSIGAPTYQASAAITYTNAINQYIGGAPVSGAGTTFTNSIASLIDSGTTAGTNSYGLYAKAQTGATNNYSAVFTGGNVGIGTVSPTSALDINGAQTVQGIAAPATSPAGQGRIYFDSTANKFKVSENNGAYVDLVGGGAGSGSLSSITAAGATNTIDNTTYAQTWDWSTATTQNPMTWSSAGLTTGNLFSLSGNALTTGSLLNVTSSSTALNSTNGLLNVANTGASTNGTVARIQSNSIAGSGLTVLANGNVGIGTSSPNWKLDVVGSGKFVGTDANYPSIQITNTDSTATRYPGIQIINHMGTANTGYPILNLANSRGVSGARTSLQSGDKLGAIIPQGYDGTALVNGARIDFAATENWTAGSNGSKIELKTVANGSTASNTTMTLDQSGNVGIGDTNPGQLLSVAGANKAFSTNNGHLALWSTDTQAANKGGSIIFGGQDGAVQGRTFAAIAGVKENGTSGNQQGALVFGTRPSSGSLTEVMRISSSGYLGIGTTSPQSLLDVNGDLSMRGIAAPASSPAGQGRIYFDSTANKFKVSENNGAYVDLVGGGAGAASLSSLTAASATNTIDNLNFAQNWNWSTATTQNPMRFAANGLTSGNLLTLSVDGLTSGSALQMATVNNTLNSTNGLLSVQNNGTSTNGMLASFKANSSAASGLYILANGNIGIGTTTPTRPLTVSGGLYVYGSGSSLSFQDDTRYTVTTGQVSDLNGDALDLPHYGIGWGGTTGGAMMFLSGYSGVGITTTGIPRVFVSSAGNVGIGTTTPSTILDINGAASVRGMAAPATSPAGQGRIYFDSTANKFKVSQNGGAYTDLVSSGSGLPAGNNTELQFNNGGVFGSSANLVYDGTTFRVGPSGVPFLTVDSSNTSVIQKLQMNTDGTAGAPAIHWGLSAADSNTGIFHPAADTLAVSTAGVERLRVDSTGNVGVGATSLSAPFTVAGSANQIQFYDTPWAGTFYGQLYMSASTLNLKANGGAGNSIALSSSSNISMTTGQDITLNMTDGAGNPEFTVIGNSQTLVHGYGGGIKKLALLGTVDSSLTEKIQLAGDTTTTSKTTASSTANQSSSNQLKLKGSFWTGAAETKHDFVIQNVASTVTNEAARLAINWDASEFVSLSSTGNLGIGTTSPNTILDINGATSVRGMAAPATSPAGQGRIYFDSTANKFKVSENNGAYVDLVGGGAGAASLSSLTAAGATNTIDNTTYAQTWNWSTATTQNPMTWSSAGLTTGNLFSLSGDALTTGSLLNVTSSSAALNSTNGLLNIANTGTSINGTVARIQSNSTAGSGITVLANGNVGIGKSNPGSTLHIYKSTVPVLQIQAGGSSSNIEFYNNGAPSGQRLKYISNDGGMIRIGKADDSWTTETDYINILDNGNVGVGTNSPGAGLHVAKTLSASSGRESAVTISPTINQSGTAGYTALTFDVTENTVGSAYTDLAQFIVNGSTVAEIQTSGGFTSAVGLKNNASSSNAYVQTPATGVKITRNVADANPALNVDLLNAGATGNILEVSAAGTMKVVVTKAGDVGFGTTSPGSILDINGAASVRGMAAPATSPAGQGRIYFDSTDNKFKVSQNGGAYTDLVSSGSGLPAGNNTELQFNNGGVFGSSANLVFDGTTFRVGPSGVPYLTVDSSNTSVIQKLQMNTDGTAGAPAIHWGLSASDSNTGFFHPAADTIAISTNGGERARLTSTGNLGLGITTPQFQVQIGDGAGGATNDGSLISLGSLGFGQSLTASGPGTKMFWYPKKAAFRAGGTDTSYANDPTGNYWDDASIGNYSAAFGLETLASGNFSFATGYGSRASGANSTAMGLGGHAVAANSTVIGYYPYSNGTNSVAIGNHATIYGNSAIALSTNNSNARASGDYSIAMGTKVGTGSGFANSGGHYSMAVGLGNAAGAMPVVTGTSSFGIFMGDQSGVDLSGNNIMAILGGNVGVGTTNPGYKLDVNGSLNATSLYINGAAFSPSYISNSVPSTGGYVSSLVQTSTDAASAARGALVLQNNGTGGTNELNLVGKNAAGTITSYISQDGSASFGTKLYSPIIYGSSSASGNLTIDSTSDATKGNVILAPSGGNVGIGTSSPTRLLNVSGGRGLFQPNTESYAIGVGRTDSAGAFWLGSTSAANPDLLFQNSAGTERVRITDTGRLGIGTAAPGKLLSVKGGAEVLTASDTAAITFSNANNSTADIQFWSEGVVSAHDNVSVIIDSNNSAGVAKFNVMAGTADSSTATSLFTIEDTGNVGIGTTTPALVAGASKTLTLSSVGSGSIASFELFGNNVSGGSFSRLDFINRTTAPSNVNVARIEVASPNVDDGNIRFYTRNQGGGGVLTERMRVGETGNVGIGTTSPSYKLHVAGDLAIQDNNKLWLYPGVSYINEYFGIQIDSGSAGLPIKFLINGAEKARVDTTGNFGIGVTSPATALQVAGEIAPGADNLYPLGAAPRRFTAVYAVNGTIQTSDAREKKNIQTSNLGLEFINQLKPVSYQWRSSKDQDVHYGFIAQETEQIVNKSLRAPAGAKVPIVDKDEQSGRYGMRYTELIAPIIKAIQEMYIAFIDKLNLHDEKIKALEQENTKLKNDLDQMQKYLCTKDPTAPICNGTN